MSSVVVVGSLNMDLVASTKKMPRAGETVIGASFQQIPGGKGANQAVAIARLGGNVRMIGTVGDDGFGDTLVEALNKDKVDTAFVRKENDCSTGVAVITVDEQANNSIIVIPGANYRMTIEDIDNCIDQINESDLVVLQLEVPIEVVKHTLVKAKELGKYTILNPAPAQYLDNDIISKVDLLIPNETELEILSGITIKDQNDILEAGRRLIASGVKELIVTLGEQGCLYLTGKEYRYFKAYKVSAIDTTAAGDSFVGGITIGLMNGLEMDQAIELASKVGALTVTKQGAQSSLPYLEAVTQFKGELL